MSGSDATVTLEEFLESKEASGRIGRWTENDQREVAVLKLTGSSKFYQCYDELHEPGVTWQEFKEAFGRRYKDVHRTSTILQSYKRQDKLGMKARSNLPIVANV